MIVYEQSPEFLALAESMLDVKYDASLSTTISNVEDDEVLAVIVYTNHTKVNIEMSVCSTTPRWASRRFLRAIFGYPFYQLGVRRCSILVRESNKRMLNLVGRFGFVIEGKPRAIFADGEDGFYFGMLKNECKWL